MDLASNSNISELIISINVLGDINFKITKFIPKMVYPTSLQNTILFVPNVPITLDSLIKSNVAPPKQTSYKPSDFVNVFSNPNLLNKVIRYIKQKSSFKPTSLTEAERKGYIKDNIELILSIYFADDNRISINYKKYPIHSYEWNNEYQTIKTNKTVPNYSINIDLYVLNYVGSKNVSDRSGITCDKKRRNIALDLKELGFDVNIPSVGASELPSYGPSVRGPYYSNQRKPYYSNRRKPYYYESRKPYYSNQRKPYYYYESRKPQTRYRYPPINRGGNRDKSLKIKSKTNKKYIIAKKRKTYKINKK